MSAEKTQVVVTGAQGFIGRNLIAHLSEREDVVVTEIDKDNVDSVLHGALDSADCVFHLAGVNRPKDPSEFDSGNRDLTARIVRRLRTRETSFLIAATSSIQAELDNPYGASKRAAEKELAALATENTARVYTYRLPNVFGKWCRPNYNSVVATFCHQVAHGEAPSVHDPSAPLDLVYVDDVVSSLMRLLDGRIPEQQGEFCVVEPSFSTTVGELAQVIQSFLPIRSSGVLPDMSNLLVKYLYSTYLSHLSTGSVTYQLDKKSDERGYLYELLKSRSFGQIFVSKTKPGVTRGNHYHHTKVEKFCVVDGSAEILLRHLVTNEILQINVTGEECRVVDIPPGYTHSITNVGDCDLLTLFWANEIFDQEHPDTYFQKV